jgi:hypothetical protein
MTRSVRRRTRPLHTSANSNRHPGCSRARIRGSLERTSRRYTGCRCSTRDPRGSVRPAVRTHTYRSGKRTSNSPRARHTDHPRARTWPRAATMRRHTRPSRAGQARAGARSLELVPRDE